MKPRFVPVTPHIERLELKLWGSIVALFLVRQGEGVEADWTLIDAGFASAVGVAEAVETRIGKPPARLVLTHGHSDHIGQALSLVRRWHLSVWAHGLEVPFIEGTKRYSDIRPTHLAHRVLSKYLDASARSVRVTNCLRDDEHIGSLEVIHVPGHAPGMIALLHAEDRAMISSDTFRFKPLGGAMALCTYDREAAQRSMRKIAERDFDHLLPSHNAPILDDGRHRARQASGLL